MCERILSQLGLAATFTLNAGYRRPVDSGLSAIDYGEMWSVAFRLKNFQCLRANLQRAASLISMLVIVRDLQKRPREQGEMALP